jgi:hypothetical protein
MISDALIIAGTLSLDVNLKSVEISKDSLNIIGNRAEFSS